MALLRGLLGTEALAEAARSGTDLLESLQDRGHLDAEDIEILLACEERPRPKPVAQTSEHPEVYPEPGRLWGDPGPIGDGEGQEVREALTLPAWKQYRDLVFLAEGGLGRIFKAFDPILKRTVALKFLRRDEPELMQRFLLEAQHQARVDHPHICKVFEVGEWRGQAYLAMHFIPGETLETAGPHLDLMQLAEVMETVAEALHAAHRLGLIHRDIKPANIMVETTPEGTPKPYVLDFGLSRGLEASGLTMQGAVIGTLHYMAPEQALGQHELVDRRTDVFSLGATLYRILTGQLPFAYGLGAKAWSCASLPAGNPGADRVSDPPVAPLEGLRRCVEEDPASPRRLAPHLPRDLELIVLKCLEKDPERRYDSALALADDLRRFREGHPIQARPASLGYRMCKYVRRHRTLVLTAGFGLGALLAVGGWGIATSIRSRSISRLATQFGVEAEGLASTLRMAYLLPRHDIRPHKAKVRDRMMEIRRLIRREGTLAEGPGAYALGQGHLALREFTEARRELERAWSRGYRHPQVALALGQTLGELYRESLVEVQDLGDQALRKARLQELAKRLRDPALFYLRQGAAHLPERRTYLEGLLAFYEEQHPLAIAKAQEAFRQEPTLYEAKFLEGKAREALAMEVRDTAHDAHERLLVEAATPYAVALDMARSDPALLRAEATRRSELARHRYLFQSHPQDDWGAVRAQLAQAQAVDPESPEIPMEEGRLAIAYSIFLAENGRDPFPILDEALVSCRSASHQHPNHPSLLLSQGILHYWRARHRQDRGSDPEPDLDRALVLLQDQLARNPESTRVSSRLSTVCGLAADVALSKGKDPRPYLELGFLHAGKALLGNRTSSSTDALVLANLHLTDARLKEENGTPPNLALEKALTHYRQAVEASPEDVNCLAGLAHAAGVFAAHRMELGEPAAPLLKEGLEAAEKSLSQSPNYLSLLNLGDLLRLQGQALLAQGQDAAKAQARSRKQLLCAARMNPKEFTAYLYLGHLALDEGEAALAKKASPLPAWAQARTWLEKAARLNPLDPDTLLARTRLAWLRARHLQARGRNPLPEIAEGLRWAEAGFQLKDRTPRLQALRGCLKKLQARSTQDSGARQRLRAEARQDLDKALAQNRFLERTYGQEREEVPPPSPGKTEGF